MDASGRTGGRTAAGWTPDGLDTGRAGHRTGWTPDRLDTGRSDTGRLDRRTPDDGTAEWTPYGGRGPATDAVAGVLALPTAATTPDRWMPAGRSAGQPPPGRPANQDSSAASTTRTGPALAATVGCRCYSAVQLAPRRTAVLRRLRVERRTEG
jgi:hypothetical protein